MKALVIVLLALAAAVVAGHYVAQDPGFIVIGYGGKVVRTTFAFFALVLVIGVIVLFALLRVLAGLGGVRGRLAEWSRTRRRQRAHDALASGLAAMAAGDYARAEQLFTRSVDDDSHAEAHYLAAAEAAQAQGAAGRRDNYLRLAEDNDPELRVTTRIRRAGWLLDNGRVSEARPLIERLAATEQGNPQVLRLRMLLYRMTGDSAALLELAPDLRRDRVLEPPDADALERSAAVSLLATEDRGLQALEERYHALPKETRTAPEVLAAFVRGLCRYRQFDAAEELVRKRLERQWSSELVALYGEIPCQPPQRQLRKLEDWAGAHGKDPGLRLARARHAIRAGHWGQARSELEALMHGPPNPLLHQLLAEIADGMGDPGAALAHRKAGLELATGATADLSLPPPQDDAAA